MKNNKNNENTKSQKHNPELKGVHLQTEYGITTYHKTKTHVVKEENENPYINIENHTSDLLFIPLGGASEIGMNLNVYALDGKLLLVDFGAGFADHDLPGVDMILPDIRFLIKHRKDILGLILTHSHEDHLGGVQYLWDELKCPIYTTEFTANFLAARLTDVIFGKDVIINKIPQNGHMEFGPFTVDCVELNHSSPEMQALVIKTRYGNIFHTGDWKFDNDPVIGEPNNEELLKKYGDEGIIAMVGDSTNSFSEGFSGSEGELAASLETLLSSYDNLIVVTTFASNLARIQIIADITKKIGRKIAILGRSFVRMVNAAKESGYLKGMDFIDESTIHQYSRNDLVVLCTGCQGESRAALSKLAYGTHRALKLVSGDVVIFSSKVIPGNERAIFDIYNKLAIAKIEVVTAQDKVVHVSGHPCKGELEKMYKLIRPELAIPVHGETIHIHEHSKLALEYGAKSSVELKNGDVLLISNGKKKGVILGHVENGYIGIDGYNLVMTTSPIFKVRRHIQSDGLVYIMLILNKSFSLQTDVVGDFPGILDYAKDIETIRYIKNSIVGIINNVGKARSIDPLKQAIKSFIKKYFRKHINKSPMVIINIEILH